MKAAAGIALVDAQLIAAMRRAIANNHMEFELRAYRPMTPAQRKALGQAAAQYGAHLRLEARLTVL